MTTSVAKVLARAGLAVYGSVSTAAAKPIRKPPVIASIDKLREAARNYPCVLCGRNKRFTVAAHGNDVTEKGIGKTGPAWALAYLCNVSNGCHDHVDGRAGGLKLEEKRSMWNEGHRRTVSIWFRDGLVVPT